MDEHNENLNKEIENITGFQTKAIDLKNAITELKNKLELWNRRLDEKEEWISDLKMRQWKSPNQENKRKQN